MNGKTMQGRQPKTEGLRSGYTTGTCATTAAKAALLVMLGVDTPKEVTVTLPDGEEITLPLLSVEGSINGAAASVIKDAGDDPDITNGAVIRVSLAWSDDYTIRFVAGEGVGTITKPGLSVAIGEAAINPVPRQMITNAIRTLTRRGVNVTIFVPGGEDLARRTFNPRLGIVGGLSILGTTGRVRPFSCSAIRESIRCVIEVAAADGITRPILVPGHIGAKAAQGLLRGRDEDIIEVSNEWGFALHKIRELPTLTHIAIVGHPGKLAKLAQGQWDTHSSRSESALPYVAQMASMTTSNSVDGIPTVEGIFASLAETDKRLLGNKLAGDVRRAVALKLDNAAPLTVILVDMKGNLIGAEGEITPWQ